MPEIPADQAHQYPRDFRHPFRESVSATRFRMGPHSARGAAIIFKRVLHPVEAVVGNIVTVLGGFTTDDFPPHASSIRPEGFVDDPANDISVIAASTDHKIDFPLVGSLRPWHRYGTTSRFVQPATSGGVCGVRCNLNPNPKFVFPRGW